MRSKNPFAMPKINPKPERNIITQKKIRKVMFKVRIPKIKTQSIIIELEINPMI